MPIFDRKDWGCFRRFQQHVQNLVGSLLPGHQQVSLQGDTERQQFAYLKFVPNAAGRPLAPLPTNVGDLELYVSQHLEAVYDKKRKDYRLSTRKYWYHLYIRDADDAFMRWEYVSRHMEPGARYCRHHLQTHTNLQLGAHTMNLKKLHVPTGWVTLEEVLRFLITDLGVIPPCGAAWNEKLEEGEALFYQHFTSKQRA